MVANRCVNKTKEMNFNFLNLNLNHFPFSIPPQCNRSGNHDLPVSLDFRIGNFEFLTPSKLIYSYITIVDFSSGVVFAFLFLLVDRRISNKKKMFHIIIMCLIFILPLFILSYHHFFDAVLELAEVNLRRKGFSWNRKDCGRLQCDTKKDSFSLFGRDPVLFCHCKV